jgi:hypothetical protein
MPETREGLIKAARTSANIPMLRRWISGHNKQDIAIPFTKAMLSGLFSLKGTIAAAPSLNR